jgi:choline-sulfatase
MKKFTAVLVLWFFVKVCFAQSPNVLIITLDTTRADHIGCYGGKNVETPNIDALAAKGVLFQEARTNSPLTLPSHATIFSGMLPSTTNLRVNGLNLNEKIPLIQEAFKKKGYRTVGVVSSIILERARGLARGFDVYNQRMTMMPRGGGAPEERRAEEVTTAALNEIGNAQGPYFMWVHYYDPHFHYSPPSPYSEKFSKVPYDGEIAYMDSEIGRLLKGLSEKGLLKNTLIVVAGDHGEGLMEHNERQHGIFLYEYALHVPLILVYEGKIPANKKVKEMCGLADIAPTICELTGVEGSGFEGRTLVPMFRESGREEKPMYIESYLGYMNYGWAPLRGMMDREYKFIDAPKPELYKYRVSENKNIYADEPKIASEMRKMLANYRAADEGDVKKLEEFLKDPSNSENLRQLMSLGYLSGAGVRPDQPGLIDPKDGVTIEEELRKAQEVRDNGDSKTATEMLLGILKRNPSNVPALSVLGGIYLHENKLDEARLCFQQEINLKPQMDGAHLNLGTVHKKQGNAALAEKEYRAALTLNSQMTEAVASLSQLMIDQKRFKEAKELLETAINNQVESADVYFEAGVLYATENNTEKAKFCFAKAVGLDPLRHEALANLGQLAFNAGKIDESISYYERAVRVTTNRPDYYASLGSLYLTGKNDTDKALYYFRKALNADPYSKISRDLKEMIAGLEASKGKQ